MDYTMYGKCSLNFKHKVIKYNVFLEANVKNVEFLETLPSMFFELQ